MSDVFSYVEVASMKLPKSVPGVNRGMSALRGYNHQVGVEPSPPTGGARLRPKDLSLGWDWSVL